MVEEKTMFNKKIGIKLNRPYQTANIGETDVKIIGNDFDLTKSVCQSL